MRHPTHSRTARRHAPAALLLTLVLCAGTSCAWGGGDDTSGGDTEQTDGNGGGDGGGGSGGGGGDGGGDDGGGGGQPSPIRVSRATEQIGNQVPVGVVADQAAADMAAECPGGELCVEIDLEPDDPTCRYSGADPAAGELIDVGATLVLSGDCSVHLAPDPNEDGSYVVVEDGGTGGTGGPTDDGTGATGDPTGTDGGSSGEDEG